MDIKNKAYYNKKNNRVKKIILIILIIYIIFTCIEVFILNNYNSLKYITSIYNIGDKKENENILIKIDEKTIEYTPLNYEIVNEINNVPILCQFPELPSGCEITAAVMLLNFANIDIDKISAANIINKGNNPIFKNGIFYGANPNKKFVGNPFLNTGYGVYHEPITSLINYYLNNEAYDLTGTSFDNIIKVIDSGRPVIMWVTLDLIQPILYSIWYDEYGNKIEWLKPEHTYLLTGYTNNYVIVNDPFTGKRKYLPKELFQDIWKSMGCQAVTISEKYKGKVTITKIEEK